MAFAYVALFFLEIFEHSEFLPAEYRPTLYFVSPLLAALGFISFILIYFEAQFLSQLSVQLKKTEGESEISKSKEYVLGQAVATGKIGGFTYDVNTNIINFTNEFTNLFEVERSDYSLGLLHIFRKRTHPDDIADVEGLIQKCISASEDFTVTHRIVSSKGGTEVIKTVETIGRAIVDKNGKQELISGICRDKTVQVENEEQNKILVQTMSEGMVVHAEDGHIITHNPAALRILGLSADQLNGRSSMDPNWKSTKIDGSEFPGHEHPAMVTLKTGVPIYGVTMGVFAPNFGQKWISISSRPYSSGGRRRVVVTFSEITNQVKSDQEVKNIFNNSQDIMCIANVDGYFKKVSPSFTKILGWPESELLLKPFGHFIHPADLESTGKEVEKLAQGITMLSFENRYRCSSGKYRRINWSCNPDPKTGDLYAIGRDVTDLRDASHKSQEVFNAINSAAILAFTDPKGKILEVNENFCKISGYTKSELIGKDHRILNSGQHSKEFFREMWRTINGGRIWTNDIQNRAKDGHFYHVRTVISPLKNLEGEIERFIAIRFDITEQMKQQEQQRKLAAENVAILRSAKFSIITTDLVGTITGFNNEAERILGYSAAEMIGKATPAIFHEPNEVVAAAADLTKELGVQVPVGFETFVYKAKLNKFDERQWTYIHKNGHRTQVKLSVTALYDSNGIIHGFMGIAKDITEELKLQEQLDLEKAKSTHNARLASLGEMSAGVAHEINNPLAMISSLSRNLIKHVNDLEEIQDRSDKIQMAVSKIEKIVNGLRRFSRSSPSLDFQSVAIDEVIDDVMMIVENKALKDQVSIKIANTAKSPIFCDKVEIEQILVNLLGNAIDAVKNLSDRWVNINGFEDNGFLVIQIVDSGPGISKEIEEKLFQPFFTTKPVGEGTGLGLSISLGLVEHHKGTLILNRSFANTCFEVRLPIEKA